MKSVEPIRDKKKIDAMKGIFWLPENMGNEIW